jgi:hypothetical protein
MTNMTDRIDRYLDGAIERTALSPEERAQADTVERVIEETRAFVAARPAPDLTAGVLRRVQQLGLRPAEPRARDVIRRLAESLWTSRQVSFRFRPAYGVLAASTVAALGVLLLSSWRAPANTSSLAAASTQPQLFVQFRLQATTASNVRLAGSFTNWQPQYELHEAAPGLWTITLPLSLGVHDYVFVVDGRQWILDPYAQRVDDGFGGRNSRIALLPPDAPQS